MLAAKLFLIPTPIGNLEDITLRALKVLGEEVNLIACEDTRQTQKLLDHFHIRKPLLSYHEHNEAARSAELLAHLAQDESIALVSDAGTPLISDPGFRLVNAAIANGVTVIPLPGACAAITALSAAGLAVDDFRFVGFVPQKSGARRRFFSMIADANYTVIAYESPHRIVESLADASDVLGSRPVVLARELTKIHEEFLRGTVASIRADLEARPSIKGEITLLFGPQVGIIDEAIDPKSEVLRLEADGFDRMEAMKNVARRLGLGKRDIYRLMQR